MILNSKRTIMVLIAITSILLLVGKAEKINADELDEPVIIEIDEPYEYVNGASCTLTISSGTASVRSVVLGSLGTTSTSVTVYLEKLVNGSWQPYTSWSHDSGRNQDNTDSTNVAHGAYRVWMSVTASDGSGSETFNVDGNTMGY